jgi:hypothetical protein
MNCGRGAEAQALRNARGLTFEARADRQLDDRNCSVATGVPSAAPSATFPAPVRAHQWRKRLLVLVIDLAVCPRPTALMRRCPIVESWPA